MKRKNLVMLVGIPGSGKSTWLRTHLGKGDVRVSRDEVRFSIIGENEDYFSHEEEVFSKFVEKIEEELNRGMRVFADATHINWASRRKLIERLHDRENIDIDILRFDVDLYTCIRRNEQREGREVVPRGVVRRMFFQQSDPAKDPFKYHSIQVISSRKESA